MDWQDYNRIAICGGPRAGKTTLAAKIERPGRPTIHTDDHMHLPWSEQPAAILSDVSGLDLFVIEGVQVPRCLRKGLEVDWVIWLDDEHDSLTVHQRRMKSGCRAILDGWLAVYPHPGDY